MKTTPTAPAWAKIETLPKFKRGATDGQYIACCPAHEDRNPSLSFGTGDDGQLLLACHAGCDTAAIVGALGCTMADLFPPKQSANGATPKRRIVETYWYHGFDTHLVCQVLRYEPKDFRPRRPARPDDDPKDVHQTDGERWVYNLDGVERVPYRLYGPTGLLRKEQKSEIVYPVEGEKDADRLVVLSLVATTTIGGANGLGKSAAGLRKALPGRRVVIVQDMDDAGDKYAAAALKVLKPVTAAVAVLKLPRLKHVPSHGEDVSDWLDKHGGTVDELRTLAEAALAEQSEEQPKMPTDAMIPTESDRATKGTLVRGGHLSTINLATVQPESIKWLWPGYIPLGKVTVLDGDPGLGKSLLTLDLAARVTTGRDMPDGTPGVFGAVVLLSAEDDLADTIRPRLDAAGADVATVTALEAVGDVDVETGEVHEQPVYLPQDIPALRQAIEEHGAVLAVIDPLMAYLDGDVNAHRDQDVRRALRPLAQCAQETGAAIVVIRHLNKAPGGKAIYRGGGSIGIAGAARSALLVAEDPDDENKRVVARVKSNLAAPVPALRYQVTQRAEGVVCLEWLGVTEHTATSLLAVPTDSEERSATEECIDWLQDLLDGNGGWIAVKDAQREARTAGYSDKVLRSARTRLCGKPVKEGFGETGQWVWRLRPAPPESPKMPSIPKMPKDAYTENKGTLGGAGHLSNGYHPEWWQRFEELMAGGMPEREATAMAMAEARERQVPA